MKDSRNSARSPAARAPAPVANESNDQELANNLRRIMEMFQAWAAHYVAMQKELSGLHSLARIRAISSFASLQIETKLILDNSQLYQQQRNLYTPAFHRIVRAVQAATQCSNPTFGYRCARNILAEGQNQEAAIQQAVASQGRASSSESHGQGSSGHRANEIRPFCPVLGCGKWFDHNDVLDAHFDHHGFELKARAHNIERGNPNTEALCCWICGRGFQQVQFITAHLRKHCNRQTFRCELCGKVYNTLEAFKLHLFMHSDSPWCFLCGKQFLNKVTFEAHMATTHAMLGSSQQAQEVNLHYINNNVYCFRMRQIFELNAILNKMHEAYVPEHYLPMEAGQERTEPVPMPSGPGNHILASGGNQRQSNQEVGGTSNLHSVSIVSHQALGVANLFTRPVHRGPPTR